MFKMSYGELVQLGDKAISLYDRDIADLQRFGIAASDRLALKNETDAFRTFPTDEEVLGVQTQATAEKDSLRTFVLKSISDIMLRAKLVFGANTPQYQRFATKEMHGEDDANVARIARRVHRVATELLPSLAVRGLTQAELDGFIALIEQFDIAIDAKESAVRQRDIMQQERQEFATQLYKRIVELFDIGKQVYDGVNEAKYNDYIIYNNNGG